jgi:hypothetical protein
MDVAGMSRPPEATVYPVRGEFRHANAACGGMGAEVFFPSTLGRARHKAIAHAVDICRERCIVMEGCLRHALVNDEEFGVWGGMKETDRQRLVEMWDGVSPLVTDCEECERSFVPLIDGSGPLCSACRVKNARRSA